MKYFILALTLGLSVSASAWDVHVKGYTKSNGTYVAPHVRSNPDSTTSNNYGSGYNSGKSSYGSGSSSSFGSGSSYNSGSTFGSGSSSTFGSDDND